MKVILGINAYHGDASAAIVIDGKLVAAEISLQKIVSLGG